MSKSSKVPALAKCFSILHLLAQTEDSPGVNEIARRLGLNKGTVSNILHALADLKVLEIRQDGKFELGPHFFMLGNMARERSGLLNVVRPFLTTISQETGLSVLLGIRSNGSALIIDKVDSATDIKISSEIGLQMPPLAGAGIKAMLSQLPDDQIDDIISEHQLVQYTSSSIVDKDLYKKAVLKVRSEGVCYDTEEYIEDFTCIAIPVKAYAKNIQAAVWALGHKSQMNRENLSKVAGYLKKTGKEINLRLQ